jgi:hypothetical protein
VERLAGREQPQLRHVHLDGAKPRHHRFGKVDPVYGHASCHERQADPACSDPELECGAAACESREEVDGGVEHRGGEPLGGILVVPGRNALVERAVVVHQGDGTVCAGPARSASSGQLSQATATARAAQIWRSDRR